MEPFIISTDKGPLLYHLFYQFSFLVGLVIFLFEGYKRKFPFAPTMLMVAWAGFFLIAGTKVGTYRIEDWQYLLVNGQFPYTASKTIVTGILGAILGLSLGKALLKFQPSFLDAAAFVVPAAMILQRVGCLFAGCCYGVPTSLPWGVRYASFYPIYEHQISEGVEGCSAVLSSPVHPVQVYEIIGYLVVIAILWSLRSRFRSANSLGIFSLALVFGLRFLMEFFRHPRTDHGWGTALGGLNLIQWLALLVITLSSIWISLGERKARQKNINLPTTAAGISIYRTSLFAILLVILLWLSYGWFTALETFVFQFLTSAALLSLVVKVFRESTTATFRLSLASVAAVSLVLMSQTIDNNHIIPPKKEKTKVVNQFKVSYLRGNEIGKYDEFVNYDSIGKEQEWVDGHYEYDCDGNETYYPGGFTYPRYPKIDTNLFEIKRYNSQGGEWKRSVLNDHGGSSSTAIGAYHYSYQNFRNGKAIEDALNSYGMYFWFDTDQPKYAIRAGFQGGVLHYLKASETYGYGNLEGYENVRGYNTWEKGKYRILPILYTRIGDQNRIFFEASAFDNPKFNIALSRFRGGLGVGNELFGIKHNFWVGAGVSDYLHEKIVYYIDSEFDLGKHAFASPTLIFGEKPIMGLGLGWRW